MSNLTSRIIQIVLWVLMAVTIVFAGLFYFGQIKEGTAGTTLEEPVVTQSFLIWAGVLLGLTAGITLVFTVVNMIVNPKGIKGSIIGLVAAAVVILIAYLLADDTVLNIPHYDGKDNVPKTLKFVDTTLITAAILLCLAFLSILYSSISKVFK